MRAKPFGITAARGAGLVLAFALLVPAAPAFAQWRNDYGYPAYPAYPTYPDAYVYPGDPPPAPHYRGHPYAYGALLYEDAPLYEDPYARGPRGQSYGEDVELGVNFNQARAVTTQWRPR